MGLEGFNSVKLDCTYACRSRRSAPVSHPTRVLIASALSMFVRTVILGLFQCCFQCTLHCIFFCICSSIFRVIKPSYHHFIGSSLLVTTRSYVSVCTKRGDDGRLILAYQMLGWWWELFFSLISLLIFRSCRCLNLDKLTARDPTHFQKSFSILFQYQMKQFQYHHLSSFFQNFIHGIQCKNHLQNRHQR